MQNEEIEFHIGGKRLIQWRSLGYALPFLIIVLPLTENNGGSAWTFWRWTLVSILGSIPVLLVYLLGDLIIFHNRHKKPVKTIHVFIFGFTIGAIRGLSVSIFGNILHVINQNFLEELTQRVLSSGLAGLLIIPLSSLIATSIDTYRFDRNQLIAERMAVESKKVESQAILNGMRSALSRKVDENLLEIVENSKEFFDEKNRNLEENWDAMAEKLRSAALETIRPFSHTLHRKGEERQYSVQFTEIMKYVAHSINLQIPWVLLIYSVTTYTDVFKNIEVKSGFVVLALKLLVITIALYIMRYLKLRGKFRSLRSFFVLLLVFGAFFTLWSIEIDLIFNLKRVSTFHSVQNSIWLILIIVAVGLVSAFINGQRAEMNFIKSNLSSTEIEALLLKREEARLSREMAKYLHGTIQSRLMASAMGLERAGRSGDKKALKREIANAYKNLKLPDEKYFDEPEESLNDEVKKVLAKWNNLLEIKVNIDKDSKLLDGPISQDIGSAINEALANSFRHGNASKVKIDINRSGSGIEIVISDNGVGPIKGKPGLGSESFKFLAASNWTLEEGKNRARQTGAVLRLKIKEVF